ncbi:MAG TPA: cyclic nucleotide-binding domain-containing protein [Candidatus Acidoferrales bacterium]|jgi:CRP-like cAMP-binding protein|nr:cyclic nucleotide-binding domain-containing protein [Candidatus Acidoferrales bacterium]
MASADKKLELLGRVPLFSGLGGRDLERIGQLADEIDAPAGKVLMRQGQTGQEFFVVIEGTLRVERDGKVIASRGPGEFVGEIALVDEAPRSATVICETPCRLLVMGHREFHELLAEQHAIERAVLVALADRVRQLEPHEAH